MSNFLNTLLQVSKILGLISLGILVLFLIAIAVGSYSKEGRAKVPEPPPARILLLCRLT